MKNNFSILGTVLLIVTMPFLSFGQIPDQIITGLKAGDAKVVASHFNDNIELIILDRESVCSQAQGEQILKDFFSKYKPSEFSVTHRGGEGSVYAIGKMTTSNGNFRVYFLLKPKGNVHKINRLQIDKD